MSAGEWYVIAAVVNVMLLIGVLYNASMIGRMREERGFHAARIHFLEKLQYWTDKFPYDEDRALAAFYLDLNTESETPQQIVKRIAQEIDNE